MKSIILFRHGKSDWEKIYKLDSDRPLAKRGIKSSKKMGLYLSKINQIPNKVICSTAVRAKCTLEAALLSGKWDSKIEFDENIYLCSLKKFLSILKLQNSKYDLICFIGHEPTFSLLLNQISPIKISKFPTGAMARINFNIGEWKKIKLCLGTVDWLVKPKELP